jgi:hypothetical protein
LGDEPAKGVGRGRGRMVGREEGEDGLTNFESGMLRTNTRCNASVQYYN